MIYKLDHQIYTELLKVNNIDPQIKINILQLINLLLLR